MSDGSAARRSSPTRRIFSVVGEILVTAGLVLLLFVGWQLYWTDVLAARAQADTRDELLLEWNLAPVDDEIKTDINTTVGQPFGLLYVPALGDRSWDIPIVEGTEHSLLSQGVGHHKDTALPGQVGNFAIAGHRTTYGAPFMDIAELQPGDPVIVETKHGWFVYELNNDKIISPNDGWVLDPVPGKSNATPKQKLLTMYACHPMYSAAQRYVWFGELVAEYPRSGGPPPELTRGND
ncbi:MAG: class E sortase [Actinomycetia bacterium]|nr:class E sortase [Actinomycetes bacterium]MCH9800493.1 class E sortase [Actinomycetes bacterium]